MGKIELIERLQFLQRSIGKHGNYQSLNEELLKALNWNEKTEAGKYESARWKYIQDHLEISGAKILDVGANTGYFSLAAMEAGAESVTCYEGFGPHAEFIEIASKLLGYEERLKVMNSYFTFEVVSQPQFQAIFLLNVVHHTGDDYGNGLKDIDEAKVAMLEQINALSAIAETLVLQVGYNWKGDRNSPLFSGGTKQEQMDWLKSGTAGYWRIEKTGIAEETPNGIVYKDSTDQNVKRFDHLGEFLNRPLFILRAS